MKHPLRKVIDEIRERHEDQRRLTRTCEVCYKDGDWDRVDAKGDGCLSDYMVICPECQAKAKRSNQGRNYARLISISEYAVAFAMLFEIFAACWNWDSLQVMSMTGRILIAVLAGSMIAWAWLSEKMKGER